MKKRIIFFISGILISIIFLYLSIERINVDNVVRFLKRVNGFYLIISIILLGFNFFTRSFILQRLLEKQKKIPATEIFKGVCIGNLFNNIYPFRLGEVAKAFFIGRTQGFSTFTVFSSVITERFLDVIVLAICFFSSLIFVSFKDIDPIILVIIFSTAAMGLILIYFLTTKNTDRTINFLKPLLKKLLPSKISEVILSKIELFFSGFSYITDIKSFASVIVVTLATWLFTYFHFLIGLIAIGITDNLFLLSLILIICVNLSAAMPSSPGMIGPLQYVCIIGMTIILGNTVEANTYGFLFSVLVWGSNLLLSLIFGLYYVVAYRITFKNVSEIDISYPEK